jgi:hypothetical protein
MFIIFIFIFVFLVTQGFILIEEETLILMAGFFWVDLAGSFIKDMLFTELVAKGDVIRDKYLVIFKAREESLLSIFLLHKKRLLFAEESSQYFLIRNFLLSKLLFTGIVNNFHYKAIASKHFIKEHICFVGVVVINDYFLDKLELQLNKYKFKS